MKLMCWNVNGLRSVMNKGFADIVADQKPDIFAVQETKIGKDQLEKVAPEIEGHSPLYSCADKRGYSGVANFVSRSCKFVPQKTTCGIRAAEFDSEGRFLISDHGPFKLFNIYIPSGTSGEPRQSFKYRFLDRFLAHLKRIKKADRERLVICGDFNICHKEIDIHHPETATKRELSGFLPQEREWMDKFTAAGFTDAFRHVHGDVPKAYTWWSFRAGSRKKNLGWRIDYFFVGKKLIPRIKDAQILANISGSDHCPITLELDL